MTPSAISHLAKPVIRFATKNSTKLFTGAIGIALAGVAAKIASDIHANKTEAEKDHIWTEDQIRRSNGLYHELARLSEDVYENHSGQLLGGWHESSAFPTIQQEFNCPTNGLRCRLYSRSVKGKIQFALAVAGTRNLANIIEDARQAINGRSSLYEMVISITRKLQKGIQGLKGQLILTGHSMGGGAAALSSLATGVKSVIFNPAELNKERIQDMINEQPESIQNHNCIDAICTHDDVIGIGQNYLPTTKTHWKVLKLKTTKGYSPFGTHQIKYISESLNEYVPYQRAV